MENFVSNRFLSLMNRCAWHFFGRESLKVEEKENFGFHTQKVRNSEGIESRDIVTNLEGIVMNCHLSFVHGMCWVRTSHQSFSINLHTNHN
jgi:hypothetical protein